VQTTVTGWSRREKLLATGVAAALALVALWQTLGWTWAAYVAAAITLTSALGSLAIRIMQGKIEAQQETAQLDRRLRVPIKQLSDIVPTRIGVDRAAQELLPGGENPQYLPRAVDDDLRKSIRNAVSGEGLWLIVVCGPSKVGKSRTLFEALLACHEEGPSLWLIAPRDGTAVKSLLEPGQAPSFRGTPVLWLNDIEPFLTQGVSLETLSEWHERIGGIVVASYGGKGSERVKEIATSEITALSDVLLGHARQVLLEKTSASELLGLPVSLSASQRQMIEAHGLAAAMVAAPALERKLTTEKHAIGEDPSPEGAAIVYATIDWARCGRTDPISNDGLRELWKEYLPVGTASSDETFEAGLAWALRRVAGTIALLYEPGGYEAYDYIVRFVSNQHNVRAPTERAWEQALHMAEPRQAFVVGVRAYRYDRGADALRAWQIASVAVDAGVAGAANMNLGVLLEEQGDKTGAKAAYQRADERGDADGACNLGGLLNEQGDKTGAEAAWRRADERGHPGGACNLGVLLDEQGDKTGAEAAWRRADERGDAGGAYNLGLLLDEQGDKTGAEAAWLRADERGHADSACNLGLLLKEQGDKTGAEAALRRAAQSDDDQVAARANAALMTFKPRQPTRDNS
jgi:tetratricopeptide (TPR) repeat protein